MWWLIVSEIVIFGGLLGGYIMHRLAHQDWAEQAAHTNVWIGAFNTFVLLTSSLSAVLAHKAASEGNGPKAAKLLWLTILGAVTFVTVKGFEWAHEIELGYTITSSTFWSFYYTAAGLHAAHVIAGAIIMGEQNELSTLRTFGAFLIGFAVYEAALFGFALVVGGTETFTMAIVGQIFANDALWFAGLLLASWLLARAAPTLFGPSPRIRFA